jgi:hypothetical protein
MRMAMLAIGASGRRKAGWADQDPGRLEAWTLDCGQLRSDVCRAAVGAWSGCNWNHVGDCLERLRRTGVVRVVARENHIQSVELDNP